MVQTKQELQMLSRVTLNYQVTMIVINIGLQLTGVSAGLNLKKKMKLK